MDHSKETPSNELMVVPDTGEVLPLDAPSEDLVRAVYRMRTLEQELARVRGIVNMELTRRLDMDATRSAEIDGFKLAVDAPGTTWDVQAVKDVLADLVEAGTLSQAGADKLIRRKVTEEVAWGELKKVLPVLPNEAREAVEACGSPSTRVRAVKVTDEKGGRGWNGQ